MKTLGLLLIALGIVMMIFTGFTIVTKKKVVDVGPIEVNKEERHPINWSPIIGGILLVGGTVVLVSARKKS